MKPSDILFRAKLLNNDYRHGEPVPKGTWFTGWYYQLQLATEAQHRLVLPREKGFQGQSEMDIDPDTLCQFTGLHDANGTPIFEGDIFTVNGHYPKKIEFRPEHAAFCMANLDELVSHTLSRGNGYVLIGGTTISARFVSSATSSIIPNY